VGRVLLLLLLLLMLVRTSGGKWHSPREKEI
jgi:hypothetical protein